MEAVIINPFLDSTINLFQQMFSVEVIPGKPHVVNAFGNHRWEISGVISFLGSHQGVIVIRLPAHVAEKLLLRTGMLFKNNDEKVKLISEMVGEFTNIIAGNAAGPLSGNGFDLDISPPIVVKGRNHTIHWPHHAPIIGLPFTSEIGPFTVDVSMKNIAII